MSCTLPNIANSNRGIERRCGTLRPTYQSCFDVTFLLAMIAVITITTVPVSAKDNDRKESEGTAIFSQKPQSRHSRVANALPLTPQQAEKIYQSKKANLARLYARSRDMSVIDYGNWKRANTAPYPSFSHGRRYLNNYVNDTARAYLDYENAGVLPKGSIIAKDSFSIDKDGNFVAGPLFIMEKMASGFSYVSGDWRYTTISADGQIVGRTKGKNSDGMRFCITCHLAAEKKDHLFFFSKQYR